MPFLKSFFLFFCALQLVKLNLQPDSEGFYPNLQVLENFVNLGPVSDLCVTESQGQELVTCSGGFNCGSLRVIRKDFQLNETVRAYFLVFH